MQQFSFNGNGGKIIGLGAIKILGYGKTLFYI